MSFAYHGEENILYGRCKMGSVDIALLGIIVVVAVVGLGWLMKEMRS